MKSLYLVIALFLSSCAATKPVVRPALPEWMKGRFADDYGIRYTVSDSVFEMQGSGKFHILRFDGGQQFLLTKNDTANKSEKGLFTRIDYMRFTNMEPFNWGFCFTVYDAKDTASAAGAAPANRTNPKKGCNGYPFSRMKKIE